MNKLVTLLLVFVFSFNSFAFELIKSESDPLVKADRLTISKFIKEVKELQELEPNLSSEDTCLDEVLERRAKLLRLNITMPLTGTVVTAGSVAIATFATLLAWGDGGWGTIAAAIIGPVYGLGIGMFTYIGLQTSHLVKATKLNKVARVIVQARLGKGERLEKFVAKVQKTITVFDVQIARKDIIKMIIEADESGKFCDGSLKSYSKKQKFSKTRKLKYGIANYKELLKYVRSQLVSN